MKRSKDLRCYLKRVSLFESLAAVLNDVESPVILFRCCTTSKWLMTQFGEYSTTLSRGPPPPITVRKAIFIFLPAEFYAKRLFADLYIHITH